ncbi:UbiA family prenyltransferase [Motilibacter rhizosphaerae]|uniref:UbiA family prenyltransferase n=1 Tax=Motilibacter rhizosphaerae TaxID=598652 RepID=UPI001E3506DE|nr:UbiA family prenyltransferase [Motilibacter rhizosphaerae]
MTRGLALSCHPLPTLAVTGLAAGLAGAAGAPPRRTGLLAAAVLSGQLAIGWANDTLDAGRDAARGRADKPVATGEAPRPLVAAAAVVAAAATVPLSLRLGRVAGTAQLGLVASGLAYDLGLKRTALSALPYLTGFGALPVAAHRTAGAGPVPLALPLAGAVLGCGAHLLNALPDLADDAATGVRSLPVRLGPDRTRRGGALLLAVAAALPQQGPRSPAGSAARVAAGGLALAAAGRFPDGPGGRPSRRPFAYAVASAAADLALLLARSRAARTGRQAGERGRSVRLPDLPTDRHRSPAS